MNLLFFPFAGGNQYSFARLLKYLPNHFEAYVFELAGRGDRTDEPLMSDIAEIVKDIYRKIIPYIGKPYVIYGHSMGGLIGYLVVREIVANNLSLPLHLFVSGTSGPSFRENRNISTLPKAAFINRIREYQGMPDEVLNNNEIIDYFEPILRCDFRATENYKYIQEAPLRIPISVLTGTEDNTLEPEGVEAWLKESGSQVEIHRFSGGHFFIFDHAASVMRLIADKLDIGRINNSI
jgi:surfactin synthase thioesterase subunit